MKKEDLRALTIGELTKREKELAADLFELKVRHNTGVLEKTSDMRKIRRERARALTVREEKSGKGNQ